MFMLLVRSERTAFSLIATLVLCLTQPALAATSDSFTISGQVNHSITVHASDPQPLLGLPAITESNLAVSGSYTGVSMYGLLNSGAVGIKPDPTQTKNSIISQYVVATGVDGYRVVYSGGELDPGFGGSNTARPNMLAYQLNGGPIGNNGAFRTVAPDDVKGGRYVSNLVGLQVFNTEIKTGPGGYSNQFSVSGLVDMPMTILANTVASGGSFGGLPGITENVTYTSAGNSVNKTFTGVSLWSFLNVLGLSTDPSQSKNHLGEYVLATGSDGYKAVFSLGELDPSFGGASLNSLDQDLISYTGTGTGFQIVVPGDVKGGRYISNLVSLEVLAAPVPEPSTYALLAAGLGLIVYTRRTRLSV